MAASRYVPPADEGGGGKETRIICRCGCSELRAEPTSTITKLAMIAAIVAATTTRPGAALIRLLTTLRSSLICRHCSYQLRACALSWGVGCLYSPRCRELLSRKLPHPGGLFC